ncbi:MAG: hypothetical protein ACOZCL_11380 [Bacillota bacterium]
MSLETTTYEEVQSQINQLRSFCELHSIFDAELLILNYTSLIEEIVQKLDYYLEIVKQKVERIKAVKSTALKKRMVDDLRGEIRAYTQQTERLLYDHSRIFADLGDNARVIMEYLYLIRCSMVSYLNYRLSQYMNAVTI